MVTVIDSSFLRVLLSVVNMQRHNTIIGCSLINPPSLRSSNIIIVKKSCTCKVVKISDACLYFGLNEFTFRFLPRRTWRHNEEEGCRKNDNDFLCPRCKYSNMESRGSKGPNHRFHSLKNT